MVKTELPVQGDQGSIPRQGTRSHRLQLKTPNAATKTWLSQIHYFFKKDMEKSPPFYFLTLPMALFPTHWRTHASVHFMADPGPTFPSLNGG